MCRTAGGELRHGNERPAAGEVGHGAAGLQVRDAVRGHVQVARGDAGGHGVLYAQRRVAIVQARGRRQGGWFVWCIVHILLALYLKRNRPINQIAGSPAAMQDMPSTAVQKHDVVIAVSEAGDDVSCACGHL